MWYSCVGLYTASDSSLPRYKLARFTVDHIRWSNLNMASSSVKFMKQIKGNKENSSSSRKKGGGKGVLKSITRSSKARRALDVMSNNISMLSPTVQRQLNKHAWEVEVLLAKDRVRDRRIRNALIKHADSSTNEENNAPKPVVVRKHPEASTDDAASLPDDHFDDLEEIIFARRNEGAFDPKLRCLQNLTNEVLCWETLSLPIGAYPLHVNRSKVNLALFIHQNSTDRGNIQYSKRFAFPSKIKLGFFLLALRSLSLSAGPRRGDSPTAENHK